MNKKVVTMAVGLIMLSTWSKPSQAEGAKKEVDGKKIFQEYCSKCHLGGGNQVNPSKPVAGSKELASVISFKTYLSAPPGHMPYYQNLVKDKELLKALYQYCKELKTVPLKQAVVTGTR